MIHFSYIFSSGSTCGLFEVTNLGKMKTTSYAGGFHLKLFYIFCELCKKC